jgi:hypothetical protein
VLDGLSIQTSDIYAVPGGIRPRPIEWLYATKPAKRVPRNILVELVCREELFAALDAQLIARYEQVDKSRHLTN